MTSEDPKPAIGERVIITLTNGDTLQGDLCSYGYSCIPNPQDKKHLLTEIVVDNVKVSINDVKELKVVDK